MRNYIIMSTEGKSTFKLLNKSFFIKKNTPALVPAVKVTMALLVAFQCSTFI